MITRQERRSWVLSVLFTIPPGDSNPFLYICGRTDPHVQHGHSRYPLPPPSSWWSLCKRCLPFSQLVSNGRHGLSWPSPLPGWPVGVLHLGLGEREKNKQTNQYSARQSLGLQTFLSIYPLGHPSNLAKYLPSISTSQFPSKKNKKLACCLSNLIRTTLEVDELGLSSRSLGKDVINRGCFIAARPISVGIDGGQRTWSFSGAL